MRPLLRRSLAAAAVVGAFGTAAGAVSWSVGGPVAAVAGGGAVVAVGAYALGVSGARLVQVSRARAAVHLGCLAATAASSSGMIAFGLWLLGGRRPGTQGAIAIGGVALGAVGVALGRVFFRKMSNAMVRLLAIPDLDLAASLEAWSGRLSRAIPLDELLLQLAELLKPGLGLSAVEIWVVGEDSLEAVVALPNRPRRLVRLTTGEMDALTRHTVTGRAWAEMWAPDLLAGRDDALVRMAPASFTGALCGVLVAERPASASPLSDAEDALLADAARRLGVLLHTARLDHALQASNTALRARAGELAASRARLASAADDARQRIERDLHDGAQQQLVAVSAKLELARHLVHADPAPLADLLDEVHGDAGNALDALRQLAHGVYPPSLEAHGLVAALRAAARHARVGVTVVGDGTRYPREVETAVYFCCLEALQNATKHAGATGVVVRVVGEPGRLLVDVVDDGAGFDPTSHAEGRGLTNMRDRIGAVGGSLDLCSSPRAGTQVRMVVPVADGQAPR